MLIKTIWWNWLISSRIDDVSADMGDLIAHKLENFKYQHYETSAYAKPNKECRHNLNYWKFGDYLGIGAGAHSKITLNNEEQYRFICVFVL